MAGIAGTPRFFFGGGAEGVDSGSLDTSGRHSGKLAFFWGVGILIS